MTLAHIKYPDHCGGKLLQYDQGCIHVVNNNDKFLNVFIQSTECYKCSLKWLFKVPPAGLKHAVVSTTSETILEFVNDHTFRDVIQFGQHGHYNFTVNATSSSYVVDIPPQDAYAPLKIELWILFIILALWSLGACTSYYLTSFRWVFQTSFARREWLNDFGQSGDSPDEPSPLVTPQEPPRSPIPRQRSSRVQSIDAFRGLAMTLMVFVNYGGGHYWFFKHAAWNGLTLADVVFPSFAFVMGMSLLLSLNSLYRSTSSRRKVFLKVFLRSLVLATIGIALNSYNSPDLLKLRLPGVLQRLAIAYLLVGLVEVLCMQIHMPGMEGARLTAVHDWMNCCGFFQWLLMCSLVAIHTSLLLALPVPSCPLGYLGPGGTHLNSSAENCTGGAARYIDQILFTNAHLYSRNIKLYDSHVPFDPEGLLGSLTTAFTVFLGVCAVRLYIICRSPLRLVFNWISFALLSGLIAGVLCNWSKEEGLIPVNKRLWSLSFSLANASISFLVITILYLLIDYKKIWNGSPFKDVGKNAIFVYIGHVMLKDTFPWAIAPLDSTTHLEPLLANTWSTCLWVINAVILAKNDIVLTI